MALSLIDVAKKNGEDEREKAYWNTYYCQNSVITANGRLYGKYCKIGFALYAVVFVKPKSLINTYLL